MIYLSLSYKIICIKASINLITMMYYLSWTSYFGISLYYLPWAVSLFSRNIICLESFIFVLSGDIISSVFILISIFPLYKITYFGELLYYLPWAASPFCYGSQITRIFLFSIDISSSERESA